MSVPTIPLAPGTDAAFAPPPGWTVPAGFDPRRGHLPDPAWPAAPEGWEFWTAPRNPGRAAGFVAGVGPTKLILGGVLAVVAVFLVLGQVFDDDVATDGMGSCWSAGTTDVRAVACGDSAAVYRVTSVVESAVSCTGPAGYLEDGTRFLCLEAIG
ncbi:LppU/SCO3897 family protein [Cellulomonas sp. NPDC055163]